MQRRLVLLLVLTFLCLLGPAALAGVPPSQPASSSPEQAIEVFYRWYLGEVKAEREPLQNGTLRSYGILTDSLMRSLEKMQKDDELDVDPILQAQDAPERFKVRKANLNGETGTVEVELWYGQALHLLKIGVVHDQGRWKIREIHGPAS
jgi:hypothetical protein